MTQRRFLASNRFATATAPLAAILILNWSAAVSSSTSRSISRISTVSVLSHALRLVCDTAALRKMRIAAPLVSFSVPPVAN